MSKADLDLKKLPRHIAVIMDGNGRWAEKHGLTRAEGHEAGVKSVRAIVEGCRDLGGIRSLSLYAFSTENWRRSEAEVTALFRLLTRYIKQEIGNLHKEGIRVVFMGRSAGLADELLSDMGGAMRKTGENDEMILNLGINYGSRAEMVDACQAIAREV
ncbi:MAG: di-trans,poly-cis-decaprenylcistransferase, partial [Candidatus Hydrogenedentes bacterium]|nr:di-trans,poly-cis-decaprenylcistransferase [Candidatus Hydrogenedentota bacterium]